MKRIDDKIKQIEKKDRTNRILYMVVVGLICAFMAYVFFSQKLIQEKDDKISENEQTINLTRQELVEKNKDLQETITKLENSMTPEGYWSSVQDIGTTKAYVNYITEDDNKVKISYRSDAIEALKKDDLPGTSGWLYVGNANGDMMSDGLTEVLWREDASNIDKNSVPGQFDIVQLNLLAGRYVYGSLSSAENSTNSKATWNPRVKAIVMDFAKRGPAVYIKIKF